MSEFAKFKPLDLDIEEDERLPFKLFLYDTSASNIISRSDNMNNQNAVSVHRCIRNAMRTAYADVRNANPNVIISEMAKMKLLYFLWVFNLEERIILENGSVVDTVPDDWHVCAGRGWGGGVDFGGNQFICNIVQSFDGSFTISVVDFVDRAITETIEISRLPENIESENNVERTADHKNIRDIVHKLSMWIETMFMVRYKKKTYGARKPYSLRSITNSM